MSAPELESETTEVLQRLVRFNTVNPPGNEREAIQYLAGYLERAGFEIEILGATPERPNLIARLAGAAEGPTLCFLGHVDTVLAEPSEWEHDPWSGDVADGYLWGRGAIDMKSQVAAEAAAAAALAGGGWRPARGSLLLVFVADEETGGELGAHWLTTNHPDKVRCDMLLNEGAGEVFEYDGRRHYGVCCSEKGIFRFTVTTAGVAGHASMPGMGENALLKLGPIIEALAIRQPKFELTEEPLALLRGLGEDPSDPAGALARIRAQSPGLATVIEPMLGVTMAPTMIRASEKINVIPSRAQLKVDCRVPAGFGAEAVRAGIDEVLGGDGFEIAFTEQVAGNRSPIDSPLMDAIGRWVHNNDPGAGVVPVILPGFSDSAWFRAAFPDLVAYGFFPQKHQNLLEAMPLVHSANERIDVRDLGFAARCYADLARELLD
jgi:acetylornithine deacetylase/succinyl-diaminopimelate desuccinylase-like protein